MLLESHRSALISDVREYNKHNQYSFRIPVTRLLHVLLHGAFMELWIYLWLWNDYRLYNSKFRLFVVWPLVSCSSRIRKRPHRLVILGGRLLAWGSFCTRVFYKAGIFVQCYINVEEKSILITTWLRRENLTITTLHSNNDFTRL